MKAKKASKASKAKRLMIILICVSILVIGGMIGKSIDSALAANSQSTGAYYEYATVDTAPGTDGYYTNTVVVRTKSKRQYQQVWFSLRGTGVLTCTLQFKCPGDSEWTDYGEYSTNTRMAIIGGAAGVSWRAIVKSGDYVSGSRTFGFDW